MALRTSRTLTSRGRPPRLAGGIIDARNPLGVSQITRITKAVSIGRSAVFRLPHVRITPPWNHIRFKPDSISSWIGSKRVVHDSTFACDVTSSFLEPIINNLSHTSLFNNDAV
jgi:hypothetical protein